MLLTLFARGGGELGGIDAVAQATRLEVQMNTSRRTGIAHAPEDVALP